MSPSSAITLSERRFPEGEECNDAIEIAIRHVDARHHARP